MSEGIIVDPDDVRAAADSIRGTKGEAEALADYARDADPDLWTWGMPGAVTAAPHYIMVAEILHEQFAGVSETIEGYAKMLDDCAQEAEECDNEISKVFLDLDGEIDGDYRESSS